MTPLRQRMLEDMQLRGLSARTQECYVAAVRQLAEHYHVSPASLTFTAKANGIVTCPCPLRRWNNCARCGARIVPRCGFSRR